MATISKGIEKDGARHSFPVPHLGTRTPRQGAVFKAVLVGVADCFGFAGTSASTIFQAFQR
jgi:hypothetical protein